MVYFLVTGTTYDMYVCMRVKMYQYDECNMVQIKLINTLSYTLDRKKIFLKLRQINIDLRITSIMGFDFLDIKIKLNSFLANCKTLKTF